MRIVHSACEPQPARLLRSVAAVSRHASDLRDEGGKASGASAARRHPLRIDLRRNGTSWAWTSTPRTAADMQCREAFDCRVWQRGTAQPVLIAAVAAGADRAARGGAGAALAVSAAMTILDLELKTYLETRRLAALLRGMAGEVQMMLEAQAEYDNRDTGDYASTLLAVILTDSGGVIGRIGGGSALVLAEDGAWRPVRWSGRERDAREARYLSDADAFAGFEVEALPAAAHRMCLFSGALEHIPADWAGTRP